MKTKILQRQALQVTPKELRKLADNLEKDAIKTFKQLKIKLTRKEYEGIKFITPIINRSKCSDTWEFEK